MNWLHLMKPPFLHRDLKTGNLLVDRNWTVKVCDFGLTQVKRGTLASNAPAHEEEGYDIVTATHDQQPHPQHDPLPPPLQTCRHTVVDGTRNSTGTCVSANVAEEIA
jgi:serine/threonine protein kinase